LLAQYTQKVSKSVAKVTNNCTNPKVMIIARAQAIAFASSNSCLRARARLRVKRYTKYAFNKKAKNITAGILNRANNKDVRVKIKNSQNNNLSQTKK
jgi:hypothetical protein